MRIRVWRGMLALTVALIAPDVALAQEQIGTLALDGASYVSYSDTANPAIPAGSTIRFRFGATNADGSIPITVQPDDLAIAPIAVGLGATIHYTLQSVATGTLRSVAGERQIELLATLVATLEAPEAESAPVAYQLRFTTGTAQAANAAQTELVEVEGQPAAPSNHVELVGAATNLPDAFPGPGEAVYAVLSGSFDWLPGVP